MAGDDGGPQWGVVGVPSSAGAHTPGIEKGPAALRAAGVVERLAAAAAGVTDHGDVRGSRWRPDPDRSNGQNAAEVARVARDTADAVATILGRSQRPLVLGGDCSITVGVMAGFARAGRQPALLYMDGGPDLFTPETRGNGNLDAMGLAHMLAIPGHLPDIAGIGQNVPMLTPAEVVSYGDALPDDDHERRLLTELGILRISANDVHVDLEGAAAQALTAIEAAAPTFVLHFDVDVLRFSDAPIADVPDSGGDPIGLLLAEAARSISVFARSSQLAGVVLTEVNPDHAPEPGVLRDFAQIFVDALAGAPR